MATSRNGTADESSPLLESPVGELPGTPEQHCGTSPSDTHKPGKSYLYVIGVVFALSFVADVGGALEDVPELRLLEMSVCRDYYRLHDPSVIGDPPLAYIDERLCKLDEIQVELAYIRAVKSLLTTLPGLVLTIPFGHLADRIGRKPLVFLGVLGQILSFLWMLFICYFHTVFPTKMVLISPVFLLIGGGSRILSAVMNTIIVDVAPESMRTTIFYVIGAGLLATDTVSTPLGSWMLSIDLWLPFRISVLILLSSLPLVLILPETLPTMEDHNHINGRTEENIVVEDEDHTNRMAPKLLHLAKATLASIRTFPVSQGIIIALSILFLTAFCRMSGSIFTQYTSKRLGWTISKSGYILGVKSLVTLCVLFILASITQALERQAGARPASLDAWFIRASITFLTLGAVLVGLSTEPPMLIAGTVISSFGNGITQALQGFLATLVDKSTMGQFFAGAAFVELLAQLLGGPAFAGLFEVGLGLGGSWGIGLPFYVSAVSIVCAVPHVPSAPKPISVLPETLLSED